MMHKIGKAKSTVAFAAAISLMAVACSKSSGSGTTQLTGAGATFPAPIYSQWIKDFKTLTGDQINYQAVGSGGGVTQFTQQTVDFGATDAPLKDSETAALKAPALEIPTVLGGVAVAYNVSGLATGLKLDGTTIADVFLGKITKWNDPAIAGQNPGATLPPATIAVVHRSDESGTTKVFTSWLVSMSPEWSTKVGSDKAVQWPVGTGGDGNDGVAAGMQQTQDSIGYLSYDFAVSSSFGVAAIKAKSGDYVMPSVQSISAAGGALTFPIGPDTTMINSPAPGAYPITSTTYLLVYTAQTDQTKGQEMVDFLYWALTKGQGEVSQLNYAPLPTSIQAGALALVSKITYNGTQIQPSSKVKS